VRVVGESEAADGAAAAAGAGRCRPRAWAESTTAPGGGQDIGLAVPAPRARQPARRPWPVAWSHTSCIRRSFDVSRPL